MGGAPGRTRGAGAVRSGDVRLAPRPRRRGRVRPRTGRGARRGDQASRGSRGCDRGRRGVSRGAPRGPPRRSPRHARACQSAVGNRRAQRPRRAAHGRRRRARGRSRHGVGWRGARGARSGRVPRRLARLGPLRSGRRDDGRAVPVGCELRGHRLPGTADRRPAGPRSRTGGVLAHVHARDLRRRPLDRESLPDRPRTGPPQPARRPARAAPRCTARCVARAEGDRRRARGHPRAGGGRAGAHRRARARKRLVPERRRDRGAPAAPARDPVHGLELRPAPDAACARRFAAALSGLVRSLPRGGEGSIPRVRRVRPREEGRSCLPGRAVPAALGLPASLAGGAQADCKGPLAVRGDARSGALVPQPRRLPLRGAPAA